MTLTMLLTGIVVFITHGLEAITGFGCTVLAMPFVSMLLGLDTAKFILAVLAWVLALYFVITAFKKIVWKQFGIIIAFVGLGMPLGMLAYSYLDKVVLTKALSVFIIFSAGYQLWKRILLPLRASAASSAGNPEAPSLIATDGQVPQPTAKGLPKQFYWFLLFLGGIVHGAFATGGPLVVLYASKALPDKGNFRSTLTLLWTTLNSVLMVQFFLQGKFNAETGMQLGIMAPFLVAGIIAGEIAHKRVDSDLFSKIVFSMLFLTGLIMLIV